MWLFLLGFTVFWIAMALVWSRLGFMETDREILKEYRNKNGAASKNYNDRGAHK